MLASKFEKRVQRQRILLDYLLNSYFANMFAHMDLHVMSKIRKNWVRVIGAGL